MKADTGLPSGESRLSKYILGISCYYHDSAAALLKDGVLVAAAEEERFTRIKHDTSFPLQAIEYCLSSQKITIKDVSFIGFYEKPLLKFERILHQHLQSFPFSFKTFQRALPSWFSQKLRIMKTIQNKLKYGGDVLFIHHHLSHAASAFFPSPFSKAAILTIDGVGEWTTTAYGFGEGQEINLLEEIRFPSSLGLFYSTMTAYLGFSVNNSEYKVMGLAAYGDMNRETNSYYQKLKSIIDLMADGSYCLDMSYFIYHFSDRMPSPKLMQLLGGPVRVPGSEIIKRHQDIAAATQLIYEDVFFAILNYVYLKIKCDYLVLAGGCVLNSVANGKILTRTPFKDVWIQPNASDGGTSAGVAAYIYHAILGNKQKYVMENAYLGPGFSFAEIKSFLDKNNIRYSIFKNDEGMIEGTAQFIHQGNVVGWFQGKMEWGPRALGARSILADPCNPKAKEILNEKVKHREKFRPFAPVVCEEDALQYFECNRPLLKPTDFMLMVYPVKKEWQKKIPAVTHVDGSGRMQTVSKKDNELLYKLLKEFGRQSGAPILINTSFNIRGEPMVCTPEDAYKCMMGTEIDYLIMDCFCIKRDDNPQDQWDSEKDAINLFDLDEQGASEIAS